MKTMKLLLAICLASVVAPLCPLDAAQPGQKFWEFQTGGSVYSSPAIGADGTVYVGSEDGKVYALNGATGQKLWEFQTGGTVQLQSSPAIGADGTVYVGSGDQKVYALNGVTGQKLWEFQTGSGVDSSPAIGTDGAVYVGSWDGKLYAFTSSSVGGLAQRAHGPNLGAMRKTRTGSTLHLPLDSPRSSF